MADAAPRDGVWLDNADWHDYEAYVHGSLQRLVPGAEVHRNVHLPGLISGRQRQIDLLVRKHSGPFEFSIAVDCKFYNRRVDIKDVEEFLGMLEDVRVSKGVMIAGAGYTAGAETRAMNAPRDIELRIIKLERLSQFQHIGCAMLWKGPVAAICSPADDWVVDNRRARPNSRCIPWVTPETARLATALFSTEILS